MTIKEAVTKTLPSFDLAPYPGKYKEIEQEAKLSGIYMSVASKVRPGWRDLITENPVEFNKLWSMIDDEVESRGYYLEGERRNTPLQKYDPDNPPVTDDKPAEPPTDELVTIEKLKNDLEVCEKFSEINRKSYDDLLARFYEKSDRLEKIRAILDE